MIFSPYCIKYSLASPIRPSNLASPSSPTRPFSPRTTTSPIHLTHLHCEAVGGAVSERNRKKLADGQLLLERFRHFVVEEPVKRKVDGDLDNHNLHQFEGLR